MEIEEGRWKEGTGMQQCIFKHEARNRNDIHQTAKTVLSINVV